MITSVGFQLENGIGGVLYVNKNKTQLKKVEVQKYIRETFPMISDKIKEYIDGNGYIFTINNITYFNTDEAITVKITNDKHDFTLFNDLINGKIRVIVTDMSTMEVVREYDVFDLYEYISEDVLASLIDTRNEHEELIVHLCLLSEIMVKRILIS
ncbi:hypothetical protein BPT24_221 [Tenacibaculum phage pT24]|uniref:Uncharacterized protein n=1 Tax=Tenacibaculum phage pT24 TaxID=1880590 RepID=A0A1B4XX09_9CAUD|nr:hypothetical protein HYP10_gp221 [Tenacibaculum phage pT24]BAV39345.1 hypothetical protein BPT24_221 [Tenacibaculum phage pT24]